MKQYLDLLQKVMTEGSDHMDRTGVGTRSIFGAQLRFDLRDGFPLVTTKKTFLRGAISEMLWFISGSTDVKDLQKQNIHIWDDWVRPDGTLGPIYSEQWRRRMSYDGNGQAKFIDQLQNAIDTIKANPYSRRIIVDAWNPEQVDLMALPPCHMFYQFNVDNDWLDLQLYVRSNDLAIGCPFNIAQYAALLMMVAQVTGKQPRHLVYTIGNAHIYKNHFDGVNEQLTREPFALPTLEIQPHDNINDYTWEDFKLVGYQSHPAIKFEVAV